MAPVVEPMSQWTDSLLYLVLSEILLTQSGRRGGEWWIGGIIEFRKAENMNQYFCSASIFKQTESI